MKSLIVGREKRYLTQEIRTFSTGNATVCILFSKVIHNNED